VRRFGLLIDITIFPEPDGGYIWSARYQDQLAGERDADAYQELENDKHGCHVFIALDAEAGPPPERDAEGWMKQRAYAAFAAATFDRSLEPIADSLGAERLPATTRAAIRAAKRWLGLHGYIEETNVIIAEEPQMARRLHAWLEARAEADERLSDWVMAPAGEVLDAASRLGRFSIQGNFAVSCYNIALLFEDGSTLILRDVSTAQIGEPE
jgi:hypothetical protein